MSELPHPPLWWTADRSELVEEGDPRAAFLAYYSFDPVPPEDQKLLAKPPAAEPEPAPAPAPKARTTRKAKP